MAYATYSDLNRYFEEFVERYYGTRNSKTDTIDIDYERLQTDIELSFQKINSLLEGIERIPVVPIGTNPFTGSYNPFLIEWNACDLIYNKLKSRHAIEYANELPEWITRYGSRCVEIYENILNERILFHTDTTNRGIGYPLKINQSGYAMFMSNWETGYYTGYQHTVNYRFRIVEVGTTINDVYFVISKDDGYSFSDERIQVATEWIDIEDGLRVRWQLYGTGTQFVVGDEWKVVCIPTNYRQYGGKSRYKQFLIG